MYSPKYIAQSFVKQYYEILSTKPQELHKFYFSQASFLHSEVASIEDSVVGIEAIKSKVHLLNLSGAQIDLTKGSVDFQELNSPDTNRILVVVVGTFTSLGQSPRLFTQSFVLAGQQNNYFVNNSVFRLLEAVQLPLNIGIELASQVTDLTDQIATDLNVIEQEIASPSPVEIVPVSENVVEVEEEIVVENEVLSDESTADEELTATENVAEVAVDSAVEEVEHVATQDVVNVEVTVSASNGIPKSYLDIVKKTVGGLQQPKEATNGFRTYKPKPVTAVALTPQTPSSIVHAVAEPQPPLDSKFKYTPNHHDVNKATGQQLFSVYVSNLPESVTDTMLQQAFSQFGSIAQVDITRGKKYAFVKFDTIESMQSALDYEGAIDVNGSILRVEERTKSTNNVKDNNKDVFKDKKLARDRKFREVKEPANKDLNNKEGSATIANGGDHSTNKEKKIQRKDDKFRNNSKVEKDLKKETKKDSKNTVDSIKK